MKKETIRARTIRIGDVYQGERVTEIAIGRGGFEIKREGVPAENGAIVFVRLIENVALKNVHKDGRLVKSQDDALTSTTWFWDSAMIEVERG